MGLTARPEPTAMGSAIVTTMDAARLLESVVHLPSVLMAATEDVVEHQGDTLMVVADLIPVVQEAPVKVYRGERPREGQGVVEETTGTPHKMGFQAKLALTGTMAQMAPRVPQVF